MTAKLSALVVWFASIWGVPYYVVAPGVTKAQLSDAGIAIDCQSARLVECSFVNPNTDGQEQRQFNMAIGCNNPDGGAQKVRILPPAFNQLVGSELADLNGQCEDLGGVSWASASFAVPQVATSSCACRGVPDAGTCRKADGSAAPLQQVMPPGGWTGACVPTTCHPLYGRPSVATGCL